MPADLAGRRFHRRCLRKLMSFDHHAAIARSTFEEASIGRKVAVHPKPQLAFGATPRHRIEDRTGKPFTWMRASVATLTSPASATDPIEFLGTTFLDPPLDPVDVLIGDRRATPRQSRKLLPVQWWQPADQRRSRTTTAAVRPAASHATGAPGIPAASALSGCPIPWCHPPPRESLQHRSM